MSAPKAEAAGLTVERREELRRLAEAATPGPWERLFCDVHRRDADYCVANGDSGATAAHIAAFDPPTVVALLDALAAAEAELRRARERATQWAIRAGNLERERDEARAAVERVRSELQLHDDWRYCPRCGRAPDWSGALSPGAPCMVCGRYPAALDTASSEGDA